MSVETAMERLYHQALVKSLSIPGGIGGSFVSLASDSDARAIRLRSPMFVMNDTVEALTQKICRLEARVEELEQANEDMEIAYTTALEHGDAIESELFATNAKLNDEVRERHVAERRLEQLLKAVKEQKSDLEAIVQTITEHSDEIDAEWLNRYREMESQALIDALTGVANRRAFDQQIEREWRRCGRSGEHLALVLCDIDFFKGYNDAYGHPAGDSVLARVAKALQSACRRDSDLVARVGGEEFALLLPGMVESQAVKIAEKALSQVRELAIPYQESQFGAVTISLGGVSLVPQVDMDWVRELYTRADVQLYKAKQTGRNQCSFQL